MLKNLHYLLEIFGLIGEVQLARMDRVLTV
jgi:hypothetical protein